MKKQRHHLPASEIGDLLRALRAVLAQLDLKRTRVADRAVENGQLHKAPFAITSGQSFTPRLCRKVKSGHSPSAAATPAAKDRTKQTSIFIYRKSVFALTIESKYPSDSTDAASLPS